MEPKTILISGAGIAGLSLARQLEKFNIPFLIIEKRSHITTDGAGIALPANAVQALRHIGLGDDIDQQAYQVKEIIYTDTTGMVLSNSLLNVPPLNTDKFVALHRHQFHRILSNGIEDKIYFGTSIDQIVQTKTGVSVKFNNPEIKQKEFGAVIGADGIHSQVRKLTCVNTPLSDLGVATWRWTCKYPTHDLQPTYLLGARDIFMAYPIGENEVYCYAHAFDPEQLNSKLPDHRMILNSHFKEYGGIARDLLDILPENDHIVSGRLRSIAQPVFANGRVAIVGDAGHACSPMLQQGAAAALEDIIVLSELLKCFSIPEAFSHYEKIRRERVDWVTASSDGPMKMLINVDQSKLPLIQQNIRENGPLNVQGWRKLLSTNPIKDLADYIEKLNLQKRNG